MTTIINTLKSLSLSDEQQIKAYWHSDLIQKIYFSPKKVNTEEATEKLTEKGYLQALRKTASFLKRYDVDELCADMLALFERDTGYAIESETVYIILGCATTTIYSVTLESGVVSVLCAEAIHGDMQLLKMLLAHEYTHFVRKQQLKKDIFEFCIGERLVTEGIAESYSKEQVPGLSEELYCIVSEPTVQWVRMHMAWLEGYIKGHLSDNVLMEPLFSMLADIDFPLRTGYVYGFFAVQRYLKAKGMKVKEILTEDWQEILTQNHPA